MSEDARVALVTGGTSGVGLACVKRLDRLGYCVFAASRTAPSLPVAKWLQMDVRDDRSVTNAVDAVLTGTGRIDVVVCAAGHALAGSVEQTLLTEAAAQMDVNFFGVVRTVRAVLPAMRAQRSGHIVIIGSLAGRIGLPFQAYYSASKGALDAWTEALRLEVTPAGLRVSIVEPGNHHTGLTDERVIASRAHEPPYGDAFRAALAVTILDERTAPKPEPIADRLEQLVRARVLRPCLTTGRLTERILWHVKPLLPDLLCGRVVRRHFKLP